MLTMLARKEQNAPPRLLSGRWVGEVRSLLEETYGPHLKKKEAERRFEVFGLIYPDEFLLAVSLLHSKGKGGMPLTYLASRDLTESLELSEHSKIVETLVDSVGSFLNDYLTNPEEIEFMTIWEEVEISGVTFFYKITREDVGATLMADSLLAHESACYKSV